MISFLLKYKKVFGIISGVLGAAASVYAITSHFEQKGYHRAMVELQGAANEKIATATATAIAKAQKETERALRRQQSVFDTELARVKNHKIVETEIKEVIKYVDRVEIKNECSILSDDIVGLLNNSINTVNRSLD